MTDDIDRSACFAVCFVLGFFFFIIFVVGAEGTIYCWLGVRGLIFNDFGAKVGSHGSDIGNII